MASFKRPSSLPYTIRWRNGKLHIEDLTEDRHPELLENLRTDFFRGEPLSKSRNVRIVEDPEGLKEVLDYWAETLKLNTTVVAIDEETNRIAGFQVGNFYYKPPPRQPDEDYIPFKAQSARNLFDMWLHINEVFDAFEYYKTDLISDSLGLSVNVAYRGKGLAQELLKARFDLARACGIKAAKTTFSINYSTRAAQNVGMELLAEMEYSDYKKDGKVLYPDMEPHTSLNLMGILL